MPTVRQDHLSHWCRIGEMESIWSLEDSSKRLLACTRLPDDVRKQVVEIEIALAIKVVRHQALAPGNVSTYFRF